MAKVRFKGPVEEIRGTLYDVVFKRSPTGKIIVSRRPDMTGVEWSEAQRAQRGRFALANGYVKAVKADPRAWAAYQKKAKKQNKRARDLACLLRLLPGERSAFKEISPAV
jgi:hypothetical protein